MQNLKKIIVMMLMLASVFFIACDKEEDTMSPADVKTAMEELNTDMSFYLDEMENAEGMKAIGVAVSNVDTDDPFGDSKSTGRTAVLSNIERFISPTNFSKSKSAFENEPFEFDAWVGTYTWNNTFQKWDIQSNNPSDKIVLIFPSDSLDMYTNDAVLTLSSYEEELIGSDYYPTEIKANLKINSIEYVNLNMTASWKENEEPEELNIQVTLSPFTFGGTFLNSGTSASILFDINYNDELIFSTGLGATFASTNWDDGPININGHIQLLDVKIQANANVKNIIVILEDAFGDNATITDPAELVAQINAQYDADVYVSGTKAAEIELIWDEANQEPNVVMEFSDGSIEPAQPYFEDFAEDLESFFGFFDDYFSNWELK